ncbi:MAG: hypothetical protein ACOCTG_06840, partial [Bacteroidota bacterium]
VGVRRDPGVRGVAGGVVAAGRERLREYLNGLLGTAGVEQELSPSIGQIGAAVSLLFAFLFRQDSEGILRANARSEFLGTDRPRA